MGSVKRYGNTPYAIAHADIRRRRRKRIATGVGLAATGVGGGLLFGTKRGQKWMRKGIKGMKAYSPWAAQKAGSGLTSFNRATRKLRTRLSRNVMKPTQNFLMKHGGGLFMKAHERWPKPVGKVGMFALRSANWWKGLKTAIRAF